jgi:hypothetical protein
MDVAQSCGFLCGVLAIIIWLFVPFVLAIFDCLGICSYFKRQLITLQKYTHLLANQKYPRYLNLALFSFLR